MRNKPLTELAHQLLKEKLPPGGMAVDATMGNGYDTLFLASALGTEGEVFAFDIQEQALDTTTVKLAKCDHCAHVTLHNHSHEKIALLLPESSKGKINAATFNLGYLPGSDKRIITRSDSTITALEALIPFLAVGGRMTVMAYPGHQGGESETTTVLEWAQALSQSKFRSSLHKSLSEKGPILLVIDKTSG